MGISPTTPDRNPLSVHGVYSAISRNQEVPQGGKPGGFAGATPGETNVRIFGDTAVLMGVITTADPQPNEIRVTLVCQKRPQGWKMIAARLTR
jgi:hypothetical protein